MQTNIEQAITTVKTIYEQLTGGAAPEPSAEPYARIPPEVEPEDYVADRARELFGLVDGLRTRTLTPGVEAQPRVHEGASVLQSMPLPCAVVRGREELRFVLEIPGVPKSAIEVSVQGTTLRVSGERPMVDVAAGEQVLASDLSAGRVERSFNLPSGVKPEDITAHLDDGILTVRVRLREGAEKRQRIEIR